MAIVFQKAAMSDLTLERGRSVPYQSDDLEVNQELYLTENMNPKVTVYGGTLNLINLTFQYLSRDNYDGTVNGLKVWFADALINYSENSFTMVDELGISHTVRLWQNKINWAVNAGGRYAIELILLEE